MYKQRSLPYATKGVLQNHATLIMGLLTHYDQCFAPIEASQMICIPNQLNHFCIGGKLGSK